VISTEDRIAAHYGSTFIGYLLCSYSFLESNSIFVEGFAPALLTLMEIPGLIAGIYLASRSMTTKVGWAETMKEVLLERQFFYLLVGFL
jgi:hypothetical protein